MFNLPVPLPFWLLGIIVVAAVMLAVQVQDLVRKMWRRRRERDLDVQKGELTR